MMDFIHIFGRLTALIKDDGHLGDDEEGKWIPCPTEEFDLIFYKDIADVNQTLLHEFLHALMSRIGFHQAQVPFEVEEMIVESISTFIGENYKPRKPFVGKK